MATLFKNNASTTLAGTLATGALTMTVANGSFVQAVTAPDIMYLTLQDAVNIEIVTVTAHTAASASLTIVRSQDGTSDPGTTWAVGTTVECRIVAGKLDEFEAKVPTGAITTSGLTMATARILGRTTASSGALEEITVGANLTLSAGTLSADAQVTITPIPLITMHNNFGAL